MITINGTNANISLNNTTVTDVDNVVQATDEEMKHTTGKVRITVKDCCIR